MSSESLRPDVIKTLSDLIHEDHIDATRVASVVDACTTYLSSEHDWLTVDDHLDYACYTLLTSPIFSAPHKDVAVERLAAVSIKTPPSWTLWIVYYLLLNLGRASKIVLRDLKERHILTKLRTEIFEFDQESSYQPLQRVEIELMYEVCRVHKLNHFEIAVIDHPFLLYLLDTVEETRDYRDESFNNSVINLLLAFNEQYILVEPSPEANPADRSPSPTKSIASGSNFDFSPTKSAAPTAEANRVIGALKQRINRSKTFGENLVFMLNRAVDQTSQILILKLLYLIFINPETNNYFYTNDLRVIIDVVVRQLHDLPDEQYKLRHTYLRVLYALLETEQYGSLNKYKKDDIVRALRNLIGHAPPSCSPTQVEANWEPSRSDANISDPVPGHDTTVRLVDRILALFTKT